MRMGTMSLYESGDSTGDVSLSKLFEGQTEVAGITDHNLGDVARLLIRGGWPDSIGKSDAAARRLVEGYCASLFDDDATWPNGHRHDPEKTKAVLTSLARNTATMATRETILADVTASRVSMHENTLDRYIADLRKVCVVEDLYSWNPQLRSKTVVRTSPTRHLTDPALAAALLGADADDLLNDLETFGFLFESMAIRDLRAHASALDGRVYHYRDKDELEVDAIIHLGNGKWAAIEVKLGSEKGIDEGAANLLRLAGKVTEKSRSKLAFLAVVTAGQVAYTRKDGVHVIPLDCLRP